MQFNFNLIEPYSSENVLYAREDKILHSTLCMQSFIGFTNRQKERIQAQSSESHQFLRPGFSVLQQTHKRVSDSSTHRKPAVP